MVRNAALKDPYPANTPNLPCDPEVNIDIIIKNYIIPIRRKTRVMFLKIPGRKDALEHLLTFVPWTVM